MDKVLSGWKEKIKDIVVPIGGGKKDANSYGVPDEIEIAKKVYRFDSRPCQKINHNNGPCDNPCCYRGFGEGKEGIWAAMNDIGPDPSSSMRQPNSFIGLRNLGATCYMNSLVQCLFMNTNFRNAIFQWENSEDENPNLGESVLYQLQLLFANLQSSLEPFYSPDSLISLLNIKTSIQQDAQEFNKLFMSYVEKQLKKSKNEQLRNFIKQEFSGRYSYDTLCKKCKTKSSMICQFYELELSISDGKKLEHFLKNYIKDEQLKGDNQYACDNCNKKVDAIRRIKLMELPPVINFQLLRYVYDPFTGNRKKLTNSVHFPKSFDMSPFMLDGNEKRGEWIYELSAVLMHLGRSANGGHYITHIRDEITNKWWKFNDQNVTQIDFNDVGEPEIGYEQNVNNNYNNNNNDNNNNNIFGGKTANKLINIVKKAKYLQSENAYMLIYSRRNKSIINNNNNINININNDISSSSSFPSIPISISSLIDANNQNFLNQIESYRKNKEMINEYVNTHKTFYNKIMSIIEVDPSTQNKEFRIIDSIWFARWVRGELDLDCIDMNHFICPHKKLKPSAIAQSKFISVEAWNLLVDKYGGGPPIRDSNLCPDCAVSLYSDRIVEKEIKNEKETILRLSNQRCDKGFWVPQRWMMTWRQFITGESSLRPDNDVTASITCQHGTLSNVFLSQRIIHTRVWNFIRADYKEGKEYPTESTSPCAICKAAADEYRKVLTDRRDKRSLERKMFPSMARQINWKNTTGNYCLIPRSWYTDWRNYIETPEIEDRPPPIDNSIFFCKGEKREGDKDENEHKVGLVIDPFKVEQNVLSQQLPFFVITENDWTLLCTIYEGSGEKIKVRVEKNEMATEIAICQPCKLIRDEVDLAARLNYRDKRIFLNTLNFDLCPYNRQIPKKVGLVVDSKNSISMVKLQLMEEISISPIEMELAYNDIPLLDLDKTLADYFVIPGAILELRYVPDLEEQTGRRGGGGGEEAFENSVLFSSGRLSNQIIDNNNNNFIDDDIKIKIGDDNFDDKSTKIIITENKNNNDNKYEKETIILINNNKNDQLEKDLMDDLKIENIDQYLPVVIDVDNQHPIGGWECGSCTLRNESSYHRCGACGSSKTSSSSGGKPQGLGFNPSHYLPTNNTGNKGSSNNSGGGSGGGEWSCPQCTYLNARSNRSCEICRASNPSFSFF